MIKRIKEKNAITLLALIITVIILLILATVSISLIINSGILDHAQQGVDRYSEEEELEQIKLAVASARLKGNGFLTTENLNSELQERFGENIKANETTSGWNCKIDKNYIIDKNGNIKDGLLPKEYQQVEYIESTGTQYIDTRVIQKEYDNSLIVKLEFKLNNVNDICSLGCYSVTLGKFYFPIASHSPRKAFESQAGSGAEEIVIKAKDTERHIIIQNLYTRQVIFDEEIYNLNAGNVSIPITIYLFAYNYNDEYANRLNKVKVFSFEMLDANNNRKLRNFIPCYSTTTVTDVNGISRPKDTIGMYDTVEGKFYVNKGTGTFLKGADV